MKAFFNEELLDTEDIRISPDDLIVQRGYGIFDFFRIVSGKPLFMEEHLRRFISSAGIARIPFSADITSLAEKVSRLLAVNNRHSGGIKLLLTGGISPMGFQPVNPNLIIIQNNASSPDDLFYETGSILITHEYMRELPEVKSTNYFQSVWLHREIQQKGAIDALYYDRDEIHELSRSNIFLVKDQKLITPAREVLQGITRSKIIGLASRKWKVEERAVRLSELWEADEVFITSTLKKVMPVVRIDDRVVGEGKPGPMTIQMMEDFDQLVKDHVGALKT